MSVSATCQITWTITETQLNNNIRLAHDYDAAKRTIAELVERQSYCDHVVRELEKERREATELLIACEDYNTDIEQQARLLKLDNIDLSRRHDKTKQKLKRSRITFGVGGIALGAVGGYFVSKALK